MNHSCQSRIIEQSQSPDVAHKSLPGRYGQHTHDFQLVEGEIDVDFCTLTQAIVYSQPHMLLFDNAVSYRETHAVVVSTGNKEGLKDFLF